ncbi:MAG TPA: RHS repeat-associated core domain-containing protein [Solirubrobacteraceae bacterium]|nr:RHS repeat-associated core domain-containing protein [Solirubrobacteraceae bacterium]
MLPSWRLYMAWLFLGLMAAIGSLTATASNGSEPLGSKLTASPSAISDLLGVPGVEQLDGGQQEIDQLASNRANPVAAREREISRTSYTDLDSSAAVHVIGETVPALVARASSSVGQLPAGAHVARYLSDTAARLDLADGKHAVLESLMPIATRASVDGYQPVDLALRESGRNFTADNSAAAVSIPRLLADGVTVGTDGISLTPVDASGEPLAGAGRVDGGAVVYPNTEIDTDTAIKPTSSGAEVYATLRSVDSPQTLSYEVGMPQGASLVSSGPGTGTISVVAAGHTLAVLPAAAATDAAGTPVPVTTSVFGHVLRLRIGDQADDYRYPIVVDPTVIDTDLHHSSYPFTNWSCESGWRIECRAWESEIWLRVDTYHKKEEYAALVYPTQGESRIYELWAESEASMAPEDELRMGIFGEMGWEGYTTLPSSYGRTANTTCVKEGCVTWGGSPHNLASFRVVALNEGSGTGQFWLQAMGVYIAQTNGPRVTVDTTDEEIEKNKNVLYGSGSWLTGAVGAFKLALNDPGVGINEIEYKVVGGETIKYQGNCADAVQCEETVNPIFRGAPSFIPDGEPTLEVKAKNAMGSSGTASVKLKVDTTAPAIEGFYGLPASRELSDSDRSVKLVVSAKDGSGSTPSSGVASLKLEMDGQEVGGPSSGCSPGPCTTGGEWTIGAQDYAAGAHTLSVVATDNAGNVSKSEVALSVHHAASERLGPGEFNPVTGEFDVQESDVSLASAGESLTVARSYDSKDLTAGVEGPLGDAWSLSMAGAQQIEQTSAGNAILVSAKGSETVFVKNGESYTSPPADSTIKLEYATSTNEFVVTSAGARETFAKTAGGPANVWMPYTTEGAGEIPASTYAFETVGGITRPSEELAPVPSGVSCSGTLKPGCRALTFNYATSTTATGESSSSWGDYNGRLTRVYLTAYSAALKEMSTTTVAQYAYDTQGRLRAEWDPRVSPAEKTEYGYDAEGHLTAIAPPGEEGWAFVYGTTASDTGPGTIVRVTRAPASAALWDGKSVENTEAPSLTGSPIVGKRMTVSDGSWSHGPIVYGYQWDDCNGSGVECQPIGGAVNANYTPTSADVAHTLVVRVTAVNGGGSVVTSSKPSSLVQITAPDEVSEEKVGENGCPHDMTTGPGGQIWFTDECNGELDSISESGEVVPYYYGFPAYACPTDVATGPDGNLWVTDECLNRVYRVTTSGSVTAEYWLPVKSNPRGIVAGPDGNLWFVDTGDSKITSMTTSGSTTEYSLPSGSYPEMIVVGPNGKLWFTDMLSGKIGKITTGGSVTEYALPSGSAPTGIAAGPDGNLWFADATGKIGKITTWGTITEYALPPKSYPVEITAGTDGNMWFTEREAEKVGEITAEGKITEYSVPSESSVHGIVADPLGNRMWFTEEGNDSIGSVSTRHLVEYKLGSSFGCPRNITNGPDGNIWFTDTCGRQVVGKLTSSGSATAYSLPAGSCLRGIATGSEGNLWVTEECANRIARMTTSGSITAEYSLPANSKPIGIAAGPGGNIWFTDYYPTGKIGKISATGSITEYSLPAYSRPYEIVAGPDGNMWFTDQNSYAIGKITASGSVTEYPLPSKTEPFAITVGPDGNLWFTDQEDVGKITTSGSFTEYPVPWGSELLGITTGGDGNLWVVEYGRVARVTTSGSIREYSMGPRCCDYGVATGAERGRVWIAEGEADAIASMTTPSVTEGEARSPQPGTTVEYEVPVTGTGAPHELGSSDVAKWAQTDAPAEATAVLPPDEPSGWPASGYSGGQVYYLDSNDRVVNESSAGGGVSTTEYNSTNDVVRTLSPDNREAALKAGSKSAEVAQTLDTQSTYGSEGTELLSKLGPLHTIKLAAGGQAQARAHTVYHYDEGAPGSGGPYRLVTKVTDGAQISGEPEADIRTTTKSYSGQSNVGWRLRVPTSTTIDPGGLKLTHSTAYDASTGDVTETRAPGAGEGEGGGGTHGVQTIYYTAGVNSQVAACGEHPEWASLTCETRPAAQPETSGLPNLPVTTYTYNMFDDPLTVTETVGSTTRTIEYTYDAAGRTLTKSVSSSVGTALPAVKYEYSSETGELVKESATIEGSEKSLEAILNKRGELTSYTDADGNVAKYKYDQYGRIEESSDAKGSQTYGYDPSTGRLVEVTDSTAGKFTDAYDVEGNITSSTDPNGMNVLHGYDSVGDETGVEYVKTTHCSSGCTWYSDGAVPSIHGQSLSQTSTFSSQAYSYDAAGRLAKVQETPSGEGCTTRSYVYDIETNRQSLTTVPPGSGGVCSSTGGTVESHGYDTADRLTDGGISYDTFGDITKLPAADAGGSEVTSAYYTDGQLSTQSQKGETIGYNLDPEGRPRVTVSTGTTNSTITSHYDGSEGAPAWTEDTAGHWTRNVTDAGGRLVAVQKGGEAPVLQVENLQGSVVATASLSETATGLLSTNNPTEYGVPRTSSPPKFSWLGSAQVSTEFPSGIIAMGVRSYVPQIGRFLQPDPIAGGSANTYAYTFGDPVNTSDTSGAFTVEVPAWVHEFLTHDAEEAVQAAEEAAELAAEEAAAAAEAEREAGEAATEAAAEAAEAAEESYAPAAKKGKKAKAAKNAKKASRIAMYHDGGGPNSKPKYKTQKKIPPNKKCEDGEVKVGEYCEKGPDKKERPTPPPPPPPGIIGEGEKDVEGAIDDCLDSGLCEI